VNPWNRRKAISFAGAVCAFNWLIFAVVSFGSGATLSIPSLHITFSTGIILPIYASLLPALYCLLVYREARASVWKLRASFLAYGLAIASGLIPFVKYIVPGNPPFPWGIQAASHFIAGLLVQLFMLTTWDEIIWRGCFLRKVRSFTSSGNAILLMSVVYTLWQGGLVVLSSRQGSPANLVLLLPLIYFCAAVMLGSVYEMSDGSIWPSVLLHALFDASARDYYYAIPVQVNRLGSYIAELVLLAGAAFVLFWIATRRRRRSVTLPAYLTS
jgi:membrane protease YdiL (CAAX protease family)